jgi:excisionase family DNA binding protein
MSRPALFSEVFGSSPPVFVTVREAAQLARVDEKTARKWVQTKQVTEYRAGRGVRILLTELEEFLRDGRVGVEPALRRLEEVAHVLSDEQRARLAAVLSASPAHAPPVNGHGGE